MTDKRPDVIADLKPIVVGERYSHGFRIADKFDDGPSLQGYGVEFEIRSADAPPGRAPLVVASAALGTIRVRDSAAANVEVDIPDEATKKLEPGRYDYLLVFEKDGIEWSILGGRILVEVPPPPRFTQADVGRLRWLCEHEGTIIYTGSQEKDEVLGQVADSRLADRIASLLRWFTDADVDLLEREATNAGASDFNGAAERPLKDLARRIAAVLPEDGDIGSR